MTPCPICKKPGGVPLLTSVSPCDACLAPKWRNEPLTVDAPPIGTLRVKLIGAYDYTSTAGCDCIGFELDVQPTSVAHEYRAKIRGCACSPAATLARLGL